MDTANNRLFIGCRSKVLAVMDADDGKVLTTLPIGERVDAVAFDPDNKLIFASNWDGTVSVIRQKSANEYESVGDIQTEKSAKTMAFDPETKRLFLSAAEMETLPASGRAQGAHAAEARIIQRVGGGTSVMGDYQARWRCNASTHHEWNLPVHRRRIAPKDQIPPDR